MFEQCLTGRRQFVTLGMLHKQRCTQVLLDALNMPGNRAVGGVEAFGGRKQATTAL